MTREEAKTILLLYRPGTADAEDPQVAEALPLAQSDPELARWLEEHCARHEMLRARFRQIAPPPGLKEQIISEHAAYVNLTRKRRVSMFAAVAVMALLVGWFTFWWGAQPAENTFAHYRNRMLGTALRGYAMELETKDLGQIRAFLAQHQAPADYQLPGRLQKAAGVGCAVLKWQGANVSMICFRTDKPLAPGEESDLWLFVVDRKTVQNAPASSSPHFTRVNQLITASWVQDGKLYLLGTEGDEQTIRRYL